MAFDTIDPELLESLRSSYLSDKDVEERSDYRTQIDEWKKLSKQTQKIPKTWQSMSEEARRLLAGYAFDSPKPHPPFSIRTPTNEGFVPIDEIVQNISRVIADIGNLSDLLEAAASDHKRYPINPGQPALRNLLYDLIRNWQESR